MEFGKWELRDNDYTGYYFSKDSIIYPSSNSTDSGKLHTEENVRNIYRDLTTKNFVTKYNYFSLSLNPNRNGVIVSPGEAVIQGYHFYAKNTVEVKVPDNTIYDENGHIMPVQPITQYTLGIALSYDAANHVTGDVVNKEAEVGESEVLSGVYVSWFDECQLECNYNNILVLGRAWVQKGVIVPDGKIIDEERTIYHGFETDPFKDHRFEGKTIEIEVHGHKTTKYDTLRDNMTQIHEPLYTYDSMHFPVELDRQDRTKPPSFVTDVQDYINHIPDWYLSKYGDYMTGALRFNNLSIDAKREFKKLGIIKDSTENEFSDSVFISPRTYGNLVRSIDKKVENGDFNYSVGGTLMTIVPDSYRDNTDNNYGYTGIHAALVSQLNGETGLRIHYGKGNDNAFNNTTRLVHYGIKDDGKKYNVNNSENTSKFIIENTNENGRRSSINMKNGEIFIDSLTTPAENNYDETIHNYIDGEGNWTGKHRGSGIQLYTGGFKTNSITNIDFRVDESKITMANHKYVNHRTGTRGTINEGTKDDDLHFQVGLGVNYETPVGSTLPSSIKTNTLNGIWHYDISTNNINTDPYLILGNFRIRSNYIAGLKDEKNNTINTKLNTLEVLDTETEHLPYIKIKPRLYTEQSIHEELVQVGTTRYDDVIDNHAQNNTLNRIVMKRVGLDFKDNTTESFTYFEQDFRVATSQSAVFTKMIPAIGNKDIIGKDGNPFVAPNYNEIAGIYAAGNIGCSAKWLTPGRSNETMGANNDPYSDDVDWVRFTRFRYDLDRDETNGGTNKLAHDNAKGRLWGTPYNIEFNTTVANRRANQFIWRYKGSKGTQNNTNIDNTPPVVLSYIHDNTTITNQGTPTKYSDVNNGTFETWIDHAGITQFNPTYKIRDFLLLENAGLVVSGDINNPSLNGDTLNTSNHLGVTIAAGRVYNSVYNDFAETYEKDNKEEIAQVGEIITLNPETGKYKVASNFEDKCVVGVQSNSYAFLAGGNRVNNTQDIIELENEYFTVGISGKVWVRVVNEFEDCLNSHINPGDLLTTSNIKGKACQSKYLVQGTIIGKALTKPKYFEEYDCDMVLMQIMLG